MQSILITRSTQWAKDLYIGGAIYAKEGLFPETYQQDIKHMYSFIRMETHVSDHLKENRWGPFLFFWKQKTSSGRKCKQHPDWEAKPAAPCSNPTWATDFLMDFHGQITLPIPYFNSLWVLAIPNYMGHHEGSSKRYTTADRIPQKHACFYRPVVSFSKATGLWVSSGILAGQQHHTDIHSLWAAWHWWAVDCAWPSGCTEGPFQQARRVCTAPP